jgi:hypothetical protein
MICTYGAIPSLVRLILEGGEAFTRAVSEVFLINVSTASDGGAVCLLAFTALLSLPAVRAGARVALRCRDDPALDGTAA